MPFNWISFHPVSGLINGCGLWHLSCEADVQRMVVQYFVNTGSVLELSKQQPKSLWLSFLFLQKMRNLLKLLLLWHNLVCSFAPWIIFCFPDHNSIILNSFILSHLRAFCSTNLVSAPAFVFLLLLQSRLFTATLIVSYGLSGFIVRSEATTIISKGLDCTFLWVWMGWTAGLLGGALKCWTPVLSPWKPQPFFWSDHPQRHTAMGLRVAPLQRHKLHLEIWMTRLVFK